MEVLGKILAATLLLFFIFAAQSTAEITSVKIRSDNRDTILFSNFEFSHTGYVSVAVSSAGIFSIPIDSNLSQPDPSRAGFFLLSNELRDRYKLEFKRDPDLCALDIKFITLLFTFRYLSPPPQSSFNKSNHVTYPGLYSLYFVNCNDLSLVTMDVRTELYNTDDDNTKDYLSALQPQPSLHLKFFVIYLCFLGFWISECFKKKQLFQSIHVLMSVLLVLSLVYFISAVADQHDVKVTGTHHRWHVLFYIFQFMRNVLFFTVLLLVGTGWCFWRPFLRGHELFVFTIVILLQVWANATAIMVGESGLYSEDRMDLREMIAAIDFFSCIVIFLHIFSVSMTFVDDTDMSTYLRSWMSLKETSARPDVFCLLVFIYMLFTRVQCAGLYIPLEITLAQETSILVFSMVMFYMYRPFDLDDKNGKCLPFLDQFVV